MEDLQKRIGGRPISVVGFSMGGLLALRLARLFPDRIAAQTIIAAPLRMRTAQTRGVRALSMLPFEDLIADAKLTSGKSHTCRSRTFSK